MWMKTIISNKALFDDIDCNSASVLQVKQWEQMNIHIMNKKGLLIGINCWKGSYKSLLGGNISFEVRPETKSIVDDGIAGMVLEISSRLSKDYCKRSTSPSELNFSREQEPKS